MAYLQQRQCTYVQWRYESALRLRVAYTIEGDCKNVYRKYLLPFRPHERPAATATCVQSSKTFISTTVKIAAAVSVYAAVIAPCHESSAFFPLHNIHLFYVYESADVVPSRLHACCAAIQIRCTTLMRPIPTQNSHASADVHHQLCDCVRPLLFVHYVLSINGCMKLFTFIVLTLYLAASTQVHCPVRQTLHRLYHLCTRQSRRTLTSHPTPTASCCLAVDSRL